MNIKGLFDNRSGRVIAVFRAMLAAVFLVAFLVEPVAKSENLIVGRNLLGAYFLMSIAWLPVAWRSWWYDHLLARLMLVTDALIFLVAVFVTEGIDADFTSPFLAMFALTILSAAFRWDWRAAARTGLVLTCLYVLCGALIQHYGLPLDLLRFARRTFYMLALMFVLVWFGMQRREPLVAPVSAPLDESDMAALLWRIVDHAMTLMGANHTALAVGLDEEPWIHFHTAGPGGREALRAGPDSLQSWDGREPGIHLFDLRRGRKIVLDHQGRPRAVLLRGSLPLAERSGIETGIAIPFQGANAAGQIVLGGIAGLNADHLVLAKALAREAASALDRLALAGLEREALIVRTRGAIARDLHDSVAQSLAGACFRLEALRRGLPSYMADGAERAGCEIAIVQESLRAEQGHIRQLISHLRTPAQDLQVRDLRAEIDSTLRDASGHWGVRIALDAAGAMRVPGWLNHELQQLVREAVANAARHGQATHLSVRIALAGGGLILHISDNGTGFAPATRPAEPWSIRERVAALGGELGVESGPTGTILAIRLPATLAGALA